MLSVNQHLLLQTRMRTLDGELGAIFKRWYPDIDIEGEEMPVAASSPASPCSPRTLINCLDSSLEGVDTAGGFVLL